MKLVLVGCPGAGKGTQAKVISKHFDIAHISTGDLLREELSTESELALKIKGIMNSGGLVSDDIVEELLKNRISKDDCKNGYILDGYPRNITQAESLEKIIGDPDKVVFINADKDVILERMVGRRGCSNCGQMYHIKHNMPKEDGICNVCGAKLVQREDDREEVVKNRLDVYFKTTEPIIKRYDQKGLILEINGVGNIDEISKTLIDSLEGLR